MDSVIKECKIHGLCQHNVDKNGKIKCAKCSSDAVQKRRNKIKLMSIEYKGGKCEICGYNKCIAALEFHHLDSAEKDFGISAKGYTRSWEKVKEELNKCILVCANCHRELHYLKDINEIKYTIADENLKIETQSKRYYCSKCNKELSEEVKTGLCLDCYRYTTRRVDRPKKDELFELIKTKTFLEIGKIYGVSDNAVRRWCKDYEIPSTKKELKELKLI